MSETPFVPQMIHGEIVTYTEHDPDDLYAYFQGLPSSCGIVRDQHDYQIMGIPEDVVGHFGLFPAEMIDDKGGIYLQYGDKLYHTALEIIQDNSEQFNAALKLSGYTRMQTVNSERLRVFYSLAIKD